uniref:Uncharacterized protein MANES_02G039400 n=1 Tax=Rhizophora mucronata TaxID=61149 RepID=A0A2P2J527_RHIMU
MGSSLLRFLLVLVWVVCETTAYGETETSSHHQLLPPPRLEGQQQRHKNAYATMMYMGTPRDYEFYVATRVMIRSLARLRVDADLVVIASLDVPLRWVLAL